MIRSLLETKGYRLDATDGEFGKAKDFLFDEVLWIVRYLVADTGGWLSGRRVVIPPSALGKPMWKDRVFPVNLKKDEIENSPPLDEHAPVSRQHEIQIHRFWDIQPYWSGGVAVGTVPIPRKDYRGFSGDPADVEVEDEEGADPFLRSANEVAGYRIKATDDEIGHVDDFLFDDELWVVRYMVVDTRNWLPGRKVLIPLVWIQDITFAEQQVTVDVSREEVKNSPEFDPSVPINREQEEVLFDYYGRPHYDALPKL